MKRVLFAFGIAIVAAGTQVTFGQHGGNPFIDHSDTGETVHVLPAPAQIHNPHATEPTFAAPVPGLSVWPASYGSGNLQYHGGHQIPNAGFYAIYWNGGVANSPASVGSLANLQQQISAFAASFSSGHDYSGASTDDYTVIQQYGARDAISSKALSPALTSLGYFIDSQPAKPKLSDSQVQTYLAGLLGNHTVPTSTSVVYGIYFPSGMRISLQGGSSCSSFCGYHGHFTFNGQDIKYAVFPYTDCRACSLSPLRPADILTIVTSHEIREAVTDPDLDAWYDSSGNEADDKCAWHHLYQTAAGGFWVQPEFSNGGTTNGVTYPQLSAGVGACVVAK
jgi:hypothetical protein